MDNIFDFGFTAVDEQELEAVQSQEVTKADLERRLVEMHAAINMLLKNLLSNPEKDYIYWPNREQKVQEFIDHLNSIYSG